MMAELPFLGAKKAQEYARIDQHPSENYHDAPSPGLREAIELLGQIKVDRNTRCCSCTRKEYLMTCH